MLPRLFGVPHLRVNRPLDTLLFHIHLEITILKKRQRWHIFENRDKPLNSQNNYSPRSHNITQQLAR